MSTSLQVHVQYLTSIIWINTHTVYNTYRKILPVCGIEIALNYLVAKRSCQVCQLKKIPSPSPKNSHSESFPLRCLTTLQLPPWELTYPPSNALLSPWFSEPFRSKKDAFLGRVHLRSPKPRQLNRSKEPRRLSWRNPGSQHRSSAGEFFGKAGRAESQPPPFCWEP